MNKTEMEHEIINSLSEEALIIQLAEECAELTKVLCKRARILRGENYTPIKDADNFEDLKEELADVLLCSVIVKEKLNIDDAKIENLIGLKMVRWVSRLNK